MGVLEESIRCVRSRWMMASISFLVLSFAGSNYVFGLYSQKIKQTLKYDQKEIDTLAFFKDLGGNVGIIAGIINELTAPWVVLLIGATMNFGGYLMIWLSVTERVARPAIWQMYMYQAIGGSSMTFVNTGIIVTCVHNFPRSRGLVIGLLKGFVGLSGAIITQIYRALDKDDPGYVIILAATLPTAIVLMFTPIIRRIHYPTDKDDTRKFYIFLSMAMVLAAFLMVFILVENLVVVPSWVIQLFATISVIIILTPLSWVIRNEVLQNKERESSVGKDIEKSPRKSVELQEKKMDDELVSKKSSKPVRGEDHSVLQALMSLDMWVLFIACTCGLGTTIAAIDNLGQIGKSLEYSPLSISTFVSLVSIWNFLGRVGAGAISEIVLHKYKVPRPFLLSLVLLFAAMGHMLIAFGPPGSLYIASIIIGVCFGAQWPLLFSIISEFFGLRHFAILYNVGASSSPLGAYLFSVRVVGFMYDKEAKIEHKFIHGSSSEDDLMCVGKRCFETAFLIMAGITVAGSAIAAILSYRTRQFYRQDIYKKFTSSSH